MAAVKIAVSGASVEKKMLHGDPAWGSFNRGFINMELEPFDIIDAVYHGHAITTQHANQWRTSENFICGQHLGLDFDAGDQTSALSTLIKDPFVAKYASFAYTTMSHTPDAPRGRVIFVLDTPIHQARNYVSAATSLLWLFHTADRQCKDSVRFFYGSPNCEFEYLGNVLPLEVVKATIAQYQEVGVTPRRPRTNYQAPADQQEVADALRLIPPWGIDYDEWVSVLMGIHSAFGEGGYGLAVAWADGGPGEVENKWRSFRETGNGAGAPVTIASVFGIAKRFGWKNEKARVK